jgi:hypothetical protein
MKIEITGTFSTCTKSQEAVRELEFAGITAQEVEVITDAEHHARDPQCISVPQPRASAHPGVTTGAEDTDLEARGKEFRTPRK